MLKSIKRCPPGLSCRMPIRRSRRMRGARKPRYSEGAGLRGTHWRTSLAGSASTAQWQRLKASRCAWSSISACRLRAPATSTLSNQYAAKLSREFHPLRFQRWAISDLNPWLWWLAPTAQAVKAQRHALAPEDPARKLESGVSELTSASLDCYRALRDAAAEAAFFQVYANLFAFYLDNEKGIETARSVDDPRPPLRQGSAGFDREWWLPRGTRACRLPDGARG